MELVQRVADLQVRVECLTGIKPDAVVLHSHTWATLQAAALARGMVRSSPVPLRRTLLGMAVYLSDRVAPDTAYVATTRAVESWLGIERN